MTIKRRIEPINEDITLADFLLEYSPKWKEADLYGLDTEFGYVWLGQVSRMYEDYCLEKVQAIDEMLNEIYLGVI